VPGYLSYSIHDISWYCLASTGTNLWTGVNSQHKILTIKANVKGTKNVTLKTLNLQNNFRRERAHLIFLLRTQNSVEPSGAIIQVDEEWTWHKLEVNEWLKIHPIFTVLKEVIWGMLTAWPYFTAIPRLSQIEIRHSCDC
jgi:hypothetical protein